MDSNQITPKKFEENENETGGEDKLVAVSPDEFNSLSKIPNSGEGTERTRYDKPINLTIEKVSIAKLQEVKSSKDGDRYVQYQINVHYSNGENEGLGGFRAYLDENGKPVRFWNSEKSAGGKFKKMLEGFLELKEPMTFFQFASNLQGMEVRVRSEDWDVLGKRGWKNLPTEVIKINQQKE